MQKSISVSQFKETMKNPITDNNNSLYIIEVHEDGEKYQYEYGNLKHAREHFNNEKSFCYLFEYNSSNYYLVDYK